MDREELISEIMAAVYQAKKRYGTRGRGSMEGIGFVLRYLYRKQDSASPTELCRQMNISMPRVTAMLNNMEEKGLICRKSSQTDRRKVCVSLTEKGRAALEADQEKKRQMTEAFVEKIGTEDAQIFLRILKASAEETG